MAIMQAKPATAPATPIDQRDGAAPASPTVTTPIVCPTSWCAVDHAASDGHDGGTRAVAHRSAEAALRTPAATLFRAELYRLDEEGEPPSNTVLYLQGEDPVEIDTVEKVDALIGGLGPLVAALWHLREQMNEEV